MYKSNSQADLRELPASVRAWHRQYEHQQHGLRTATRVTLMACLVAAVFVILALSGCTSPVAPEVCTEPAVASGTWTEAGYVITVQGCYRPAR